MKRLKPNVLLILEAAHCWSEQVDKTHNLTSTRQTKGAMHQSLGNISDKVTIDRQGLIK